MCRSPLPQPALLRWTGSPGGKFGTVRRREAAVRDPLSHSDPPAYSRRPQQPDNRAQIRPKVQTNPKSCSDSTQAPFQVLNYFCFFFLLLRDAKPGGVSKVFWLFYPLPARSAPPAGSKPATILLFPHRSGYKSAQLQHPRQAPFIFLLYLNTLDRNINFIVVLMH